MPPEKRPFRFGADFEKPSDGQIRSPFFQRAGQTLFTRGEFVSPNFKKGVMGWMVDEFGNVEFNNGVFRGDVILGTTVRTVDTASEIQSAIDAVSADGGGSIYIAPGTYNMTSNIDIPSNVYIIGASRSAVILDFGSGAFGVRALGTVGSHISNILVKDLTIQNSSITGLEFNYVDVSLIEGVDVFGCAIGIEWENVDSVGLLGMGSLCDGNGTNMKITNSASFSVYFTALLNSTTGHGLELSGSSSATIFDSGMSDNTGDGINITSCSNIAFISLAVDGNGGQGVELVSGNNDLQFTAVNPDGNTSDGYKLTATTDRVSIIGSSIINNGGYGINIAASTCDNNQIIAPAFNNNTSGTINNDGTNTFVTPQGIYGEDTGGNDSYSITLSPKPVLTPGLKVIFKVATANTGAAALDVNGTGSVAIVKAVNTTLADNDIIANMLCMVVYDGTNWVLMNPRTL